MCALGHKTGQCYDNLPKLRAMHSDSDSDSDLLHAHVAKQCRGGVVLAVPAAPHRRTRQSPAPATGLKVQRQLCEGYLLCLPAPVTPDGWWLSVSSSSRARGFQTAPVEGKLSMGVMAATRSAGERARSASAETSGTMAAAGGMVTASKRDGEPEIPKHEAFCEIHRRK